MGKTGVTLGLCLAIGCGGGDDRLNGKDRDARDGGADAKTASNTGNTGGNNGTDAGLGDGGNGGDGGSSDGGASTGGAGGAMSTVACNNSLDCVDAPGGGRSATRSTASASSA
jgi:hypothetical protein